MNNYLNSKLKIFEHQGKNQYALINKSLKGIFKKRFFKQTYSELKYKDLKFK